MTSANESLQIRLVIKALLKKNGLHQKDLAKGLRISVPTVKRILNGKELGLERLVQIAGFFHLSVYELFDLCRQKNLESYEFNETQEKFLAKEPLNVVIFRSLIIGYSPNQIKTRYKLTEARLEKILIGLDKVNLIEFWNNDKIKVRAKWPFKWINGGILQKTYLHQIFEKILENSSSVSKLSDENENLFKPFEILLRESSYEQLQKDLKQVLENYRAISKFEMLTSNASDLKEVTGLVIADNFSAWDRLI